MAADRGEKKIFFLIGTVYCLNIIKYHIFSREDNGPQILFFNIMYLSLRIYLHWHEPFLLPTSHNKCVCYSVRSNTFTF